MLNDSCDVIDKHRKKTNKRKRENEDCYEVAAHNPIVQNIVKGARYCGKKGGMSFVETIRPVLVDGSSNEYQCPDGYLPCFEITAQSAEYVTCRPKYETIEDYCPITSYVFDI